MNSEAGTVIRTGYAVEPEMEQTHPARVFPDNGERMRHQQTNPPRSESQLSLIEARKARSDPKLAAGLYLDAVDAALRSINGTSDGAGRDARVVYNRACQELTVLLQANPQLWNRTESIQSCNHVYRLQLKLHPNRPALLLH